MRRPERRAAAARLAAMVVFPVPPFWLSTAMVGMAGHPSAPGVPRATRNTGATGATRDTGATPRAGPPRCSGTSADLPGVREAVGEPEEEEGEEGESGGREVSVVSAPSRRAAPGGAPAGSPAPAADSGSDGWIVRGASSARASCTRTRSWTLPPPSAVTRARRETPAVAAISAWVLPARAATSCSARVGLFVFLAATVTPLASRRFSAGSWSRSPRRGPILAESG